MSILKLGTSGIVILALTLGLVAVRTAAAAEPLVGGSARANADDGQDAAKPSAERPGQLLPPVLLSVTVVPDPPAPENPSNSTNPAANRLEARHSSSSSNPQ